MLSLQNKNMTKPVRIMTFFLLFVSLLFVTVNAEWEISEPKMGYNGLVLNLDYTVNSGRSLKVPESVITSMIPVRRDYNGNKQNRTLRQRFTMVEVMVGGLKL